LELKCGPTTFDHFGFIFVSPNGLGLVRAAVAISQLRAGTSYQAIVFNDDNQYAHLGCPRGGGAGQ
jgi:hypothetical protein